MGRIIVPESETILDKEFSVLDRGSVRLVDYLCVDARIVAAARVSYGPGTTSVREMEKALTPVAFQVFEDILHSVRLSRSLGNRLRELLWSRAQTSPEVAYILGELEQ
jgi:hypothetical protein